jgi:hypothetical protein
MTVTTVVMVAVRGKLVCLEGDPPVGQGSGFIQSSATIPLGCSSAVPVDL